MRIDPREPISGYRNLEYEAWLDGTFRDDQREDANGELNSRHFAGQIALGQVEAVIAQCQAPVFAPMLFA